jgi:hypothetical protein
MVRMLVQVMLKPPVTPETSERIRGAIEDAIGDVLRGSVGSCFVQLLVDSIRKDKRRPEGARVAVMVHVGGKHSDRLKRKLYGGILESLERELAIARTAVIIGIVELPVANWSCGYSEQQWLDMLSYQLP